MANPLPEWALACIPWDRLGRPERRTLERFVQRHPKFEVAMARWPAAHHLLQEIVAEQYVQWSTTASAVVPPEVRWEAAVDKLSRLRSPADIDRWLSDHRLSTLADQSFAEMARIVGITTWFRGTVRTALMTHGTMEDALDVVYAALVSWDTHRDLIEATHRQWAQPVEEMEFLTAQKACLAVAQLDHIYLPATYMVTFETDPPTLVAHRSTLRVDTGQAIDLSPMAARSILDFLTSPKHRQERQGLAQVLRMPRTERDLLALTKRLSRLSPTPTSEGEFGWLLKGSTFQWEIEPLRLTPKARGDGFKTKILKRGDPWPSMLPIDQIVSSRGTLIGRLDELRGHPRVLVRVDGSCDGRPRRVRRVALDLAFRQTPEGAAVHIELEGVPVEPAALLGRDRVARHWFVTTSDTEIRVAPISEALASVHDLLVARGSLVLPDGAALLQSAPWLADQVSVTADRGVMGASVPSDDRPVLRLTLEGNTLHVNARVQPIPEAPSHPPGRGPALIFGQRSGASVHVQRDLATEPSLVRQALTALPLATAAEDEPFTWRIDGLQRALELVEAVRTLAEAVRVQWGGDRPVLASRRVEASDLSMRVSSQRDWFGLEGDVEIDGQRVSLSALMEAALEGHAWVPLSSGQWVRVSEGLRQHLSAAAVATERKGDATALQAVHAPLLAPLIDDGAQLDAPVAWTGLASRCREAATMEPPLSKALKATLRPYQRDGVQWLSRLAHWAPGAVLADDMGLGKTIQTIAVLLDRAGEPALVVAPTSLLHNWQRELARFAPSLDVHVYHGSGRTLEPAPGRVILTTYGLLGNDVDALKATRFGTVVFDEAHALKNPSAQRSTAARALDAAFVIALTGTPVENRVAELWSLFRVVVPGLLGTAAGFRQRFVQPIEVDGDRDRRTTLARLVAPFLLRRTKRQVATDLPDRTELTRQVELSAAERTLYDRTRLASVARLESAGTGKRMQILEELLRLRMLACHPKLVDATSTVESSKLKAVRRLVSDFRDADQRILLFSTFTTHLALIREALVADGHQVQYLDGSMTPRQRTAAVDAFQAGEGHVFLISTKAGGVGLNLTAASAVIHVDPWWNPASEDQATDRAHRIGQRQPVTVVRVVAAGTIEEQIVALHATKRDLAEALLAESGSSSPVSLDELLHLLTAAESPATEPPQEPPPALLIEEAQAEASPPEAAPPAPTLGSDTAPLSLSSAFRAELDAAFDRGDIQSPNTLRSYRRAVEHFLAWHPGPYDRDALADAGERYVDAVKAGEVPHKSDKVYAKPAIRRLVQMLQGGRSD